MKKNKILLFVLIFLLAFSYSKNSYAQEDTNRESKFGIGSSLSNLVDLILSDGDPVSLIYLTFDLDENIRIEPTISFGFAEDYNQYSLGIGAFGKKPSSKFDLLYGLRLAINNEKLKTIAPTIGGEYYFIENFSIGSEVQIQGLIRDEDWVIFPYASMLLRFYF